MNSFELFPTKLRGDNTDRTPIRIWTPKFRAAARISKVQEEDKIDIFKLWIEGDIAAWQEDTETKQDTKTWGLDDWLEALVKHMESKTPAKQGNIISLSQMTKESNETMDEFNTRFSGYLRTIPTEMYTTKWIRESELMQKSELLMRLKCSMAGKPDPKKSATPRKDEKSEVSMPQADVADLIGYMKALTLLVSQRLGEKENSPITCYSCGKQCHTSSVCRSNPAPKLTSAPTSDNSSAMLAISDSSNTHSTSPPIVSRLGLANNKDAVNQKKKKGKVAQASSEWSSRVLKAPAHITVLKRTKDNKIFFAKSAKEELTPFSYILAFINKDPVPVFIDSGATYLIISRAFGESLNMPFKKIQLPISIVVRDSVASLSFDVTIVFL
ncbi:hypothetical protein BB561_006026 [Smittium simulii]|uniref:Uncharacterized protein n=1 Tax=Smittium simulii TaxID=133385 RepID=A0A2T9Y707_9FUNG|nr:hypothetical protein BB561_006026 [Smittium simulii]